MLAYPAKVSALARIDPKRTRRHDSIQDFVAHLASAGDGQGVDSGFAANIHSIVGIAAAAAASYATVLAIHCPGPSWAVCMAFVETSCCLEVFHSQIAIML